MGIREDALDSSAELRHDQRQALAGFLERTGMHIGLRGYAAYIKTRTTNVVALEDDDLQALLGGIFSGAVTTRARADDNQISFIH
jgi:hypothetical protein